MVKFSIHVVEEEEYTGAPYPCPPAPYEACFLIRDALKQRGLWEKTELKVCTIQPMLMPNAGPEGSSWMAQELAKRDIKVGKVGGKIVKIEEKAIQFEGETVPFDLLLSIPPHRPPKVVLSSGLTTQEVPWIKADPSFFTTSVENVWALGDCTLIPLANGLPLPKAGLIAVIESKIVAQGIAHKIDSSVPAPRGYDGIAHCYIEVGFEAAARVNGDWYAKPKPVVTITPPTAENALEKTKWEAELLAKWFGA